MIRAGSVVTAALAALLLWTPALAGPTSCLTGTAVAVSADPAAVAQARSTIAAMCPCASFDGSSGKTRAAYQKCAARVTDALVRDGALRAECRSTVRKMSSASVCGQRPSAESAPCVRRTTTGRVTCSIQPAARCVDRPGSYAQTACAEATHCLDAADTTGDLLIDSEDAGRCGPASTPSPPPLFTPSPTPTPTPTPAPTPTRGPSEPQPFPTGSFGERLARLVNEYRAENGKEPVPLSKTLMAVAGAHVLDLLENPSILTPLCNLHSWSSGESLWSGCCYDAAHSQASCMWDKPRQISTSLGYARYPASGYEITYRGWYATPEMVMDLWKSSPGHRDVILNRGMWASHGPFPAMGAAMRGEFAVVWFGDARDPEN